jgi:predicted RND superfamily exporter protein
VLDAVRAAAAAHPQVRIAETGDASINKAVNDTMLRDPHRAELLSFPIMLVVLLLIAFGASDLPQATAALQTYNRIQQVFPGGGSPAVVVIEARDVTAPAVVAAGRAFELAALASGQMNEPITFIVNPAHTAAIIQVPLAGTGEDTASIRAWLRCGTRLSRRRWAGCPASGSR